MRSADSHDHKNINVQSTRTRANIHTHAREHKRIMRCTNSQDKLKLSVHTDEQTNTQTRTREYTVEATTRSNAATSSERIHFDVTSHVFLLVCWMIIGTMIIIRMTATTTPMIILIRHSFHHICLCKLRALMRNMSELFERCSDLSCRSSSRSPRSTTRVILVCIMSTTSST